MRESKESKYAPSTFFVDRVKGIVYRSLSGTTIKILGRNELEWLNHGEIPPDDWDFALAAAKRAVRDSEALEASPVTHGAGFIS